MTLDAPVQLMFSAFALGVGFLFCAGMLLGFVRWGIKEMIG